jgi:hypothetical protein
LREQRLAQVHSSPPEKLISGSYLNSNMGRLISNRHQKLCATILAIKGVHVVTPPISQTGMLLDDSQTGE